MCESIFKNQEEKKRKDEFTRLFASLVTSNVVKHSKAQKKEKALCQSIGG